MSIGISLAWKGAYLAAWSAAELDRSPASAAPRRTRCPHVTPARAGPMLRAARPPVPAGSALPALLVPVSRSLPLAVLAGAASTAWHPLPCSFYPLYPDWQLPVLNHLACGEHGAAADAGLRGQNSWSLYRCPAWKSTCVCCGAPLSLTVRRFINQ